MKLYQIFIIIIIISVGCKNPSIELINEKIDNLANTIHERGGLIDSNFIHFNEIEKLKYLTKELNGYMFLTDQMTKSDHKFDTVKLDSNYYGCMFLSGYNRYLPSKMIIKYNDSIIQIPIDDKYIEYNYKLRPKKLGANMYNGFIVQGKDTYNFGYTFYVTN